MRKFVAMLLGAAMVLSLAACGGNTTTTTGSDSEATGTIKAGLITLHDENSTYDNNFITAFKEACEACGVTPVIKTGIPEGQECYDAAVELVEGGCSVVFADSFGHEDYILQAAKEYPDVQFAHATGTQAHTAGLSNFHNAFASIYEGRYLAGVAAGLKLNDMIDAGEITEDEAVMGYVGAFTYAEVISGYTSFYLGAKSVCPSVTMKVTFTGSWYDETAEKEGANNLIAAGCVLISQHADSFGAPTACETAGVPNVSYNGSTKSVGPNSYLISTRINWAPYFELLFNNTMEGKETPADYVGTIEDGSVEMCELNEDVAAAGTADKLEEVKKGLQDGSIKVFDTSTFTVGGETLTSYEADVDTDAAYTKDTEVIKDGEFLESEYRSAPYFDIQIDGIELLDTNFG